MLRSQDFAQCSVLTSKFSFANNNVNNKIFWKMLSLPSKNINHCESIWMFLQWKYYTNFSSFIISTPPTISTEDIFFKCRKLFPYLTVLSLHLTRINSARRYEKVNIKWILCQTKIFFILPKIRKKNREHRKNREKIK